MDDSQPKSTDNTCKGTNSNTRSDIVDSSSHHSNHRSSAQHANQGLPYSDLEVPEDQATDIGADNAGSECEVDVEWALTPPVDVGGGSGVVENAGEGEAGEDEASSNEGDEGGVPRACWKRLARSDVEDDRGDQREEASKDIDIVGAIIIIKQRIVGGVLLLHILSDDIRERPSNIEQQDHNKSLSLAQPANKAGQSSQQRGAQNHRDPFGREADFYIGSVEPVEHLIPKRQQKGRDLHADANHDQGGHQSSGRRVIGVCDEQSVSQNGEHGGEGVEDDEI